MLNDELKLKKAWRKYFLKRKLKTILVYFLSLISTSILVYLALSLPAQLVKAKYFFQHLGKKEKPSQILSPKLAQTSLYLPEIKEKVKEIEQEKSPLADLEDNHLLIPKINVKAPIIWNSEVDEKTMLKNLEKGVVHYKGTALPDEKGNVFISGHSSGAWWRPGAYKTVFSLLDKLEKDDEIVLSYQNKVYVYKVFDKLVVKPKDVWVLKPTSEPVLSLMTCVPVGTDLKRLIVRASPLSVVEKQIQKEIKKEPLLQLPDFLYP